MVKTPAQASIARATRGRIAAGMGAGVTLLLAAAVVGMVHYLGARHYARWDWSRARFYGLSDKTRQLLAALDRDVEVIVFFQAGREVFADVDNLLQEYRAASPRLRVARVDPDRDLARAAELKRQVPLVEANVVLFRAGERTHLVKEEDLADYAYRSDAEGARRVQQTFRGEQVFTSAIQAVTQARRPVVYLLAGHGERDPANYDKGVGLADLARLVRQDNIDVRPLRLGEDREVPSDADAIVVAGPRLRFAQPELDLLGRYLDRNGRAVFLLDARTDTGLAALLASWGVRVGAVVVIDPTRTLTGRELFVTRYGQHPVTERLAGVTCILYLPRPVEAADPAGAPPRLRMERVVPLAFTSPAGWAEADPDGKPLRFDPGRDRQGPVPVAAAVERGPVPGIDMQIRSTRLVVFGDSQFVSNGALAGGNADLFLGALNWLLGREELAAVGPKTVEEMRLRMSAVQLRWLALLVVVAMPSVAGVFGVLVWLRRRR